MGSSSSSLIPVVGQAYIKKSVKGSSSMRLVNILMDGTAATYICKQLQEPEEETAQGVNETGGIRSAMGNIDLLISRSDLPKEVKMTVSFFEKAKNINLDANIKKKITLTGDLVNYFKSS